MEKEIPKDIDTKIHPVNRIYNLTEEEMKKMKGEEGSIKYPTAYDRNKSLPIVELTEEMKKDIEEKLKIAYNPINLDSAASNT